LFAHYREQLYRFCLARLRSREEAEDAVQNVFMRVHMALQRGVVPRFEAAWLYKIAHNVCLSRVESTARRARVESPQPLDDEDYAAAAPEASYDELAGLSEALHAMPANLRQALVLREWQGLSYAEIAEAMGTTVPAVETLIFRARRHLAAALEQGVPAPRRRLAARILDVVALRGLLLRLRGLFAGAAPAKLAAGAALLALGGGGLGAAVALSDSSAQPTPVVPTVAPSPAVAAVARHASPRRPAAAQTRTAARVVRRAAVPSTPAFAPSPAAPTLAPIAVPPVPPTTTTTSALVPVQSPLPPLQVPTVQTPTVSVPTVSVPSVSVPAVTVPSVDVPSVDVPTVDVTSPLPAGVAGIVTVGG
jgi:RNA polymerase sigma factor (sigma-70 family)